MLCCYRVAGGFDAERVERARQKEVAAARDRRNFEWLQQLRREGFRKVSCRQLQPRGVKVMVCRRMYFICHLK